MILEHTGGDTIAEAEVLASSDHAAEEEGDERQSSFRLRRSSAEKRALVEMAMAPGSSVREVAACFDLSPSQIYTWRKQMADGELDDPVETPVFARVSLTAEEPACPVSSTTGDAGQIIVAFPSGVSVRIEGPVDHATVALILGELGR